LGKIDILDSCKPGSEWISIFLAFAVIELSKISETAEGIV